MVRRRRESAAARGADRECSGARHVHRRTPQHLGRALLAICRGRRERARPWRRSGSPPALVAPGGQNPRAGQTRDRRRSEEHTSELQSRQYLVCRLLLEKKKEGKCFGSPIRTSARGRYGSFRRRSGARGWAQTSRRSVERVVGSQRCSISFFFFLTGGPPPLPPLSPHAPLPH